MICNQENIAVELLKHPDHVYIQKYIFDLERRRIYPIIDINYSGLYMVANEAPFADGGLFKSKKSLKKLVDIHDVFIMSDLASAVGLCKEQVKLCNLSLFLNHRIYRWQ
jgi:hypothetical protein